MKWAIIPVLFLQAVIFGGCDKPPEISLLVWVGSDVFGSSKTDNYLKTEVSTDRTASAPVTLVDGQYILTSEVTLIAFMCKAPYPVEWEFSNSKWLLLQEKTFGLYLTTSRRISDEADIHDTRAFRYWSELALLGDSRMYIGSYTCKSSKDDRLFSNFTLFWEGGPSDNVFVLSGKNITVYVEKDNRVILPCQVNDPYVNVALKFDAGVPPGSNKTENWVPVFPVIPAGPSKWSYKPATGFIYTGDNNKIQDDYPPPGNYKCVLLNDQNKEDEDSEDVVNMIVFLGVDITPNLLDAPIKSNATFGYNQKLRQYECCSSSATPPRILIHSCCDPATCSELIPAMKTQLSSIAPDQMTSSVNQLYSQLASYFNHKNGSCIYNNAWRSSAEMDFVQCIGDGISTVRKFMPRNYKNLAFDIWDADHLRPWVNIQPMTWRTPNYPVTLVTGGKNDTFKVYSGTTVTFRCRTSFYFFSYGIRFSTVSGGHKPRFLPDTFEAQSRKRMPNYKMLLLLHNPPLSAEVNVTITQDIKSLTCYAPVTNSSEWVEQTIKFSVKVAEKPTIVEDNESSENIVWTLNATNMALKCKTRGQPPPRVVWTKDSKPVGRQFNQTRHNQTYTLLISRAAHEVQGQYRCTAMNFKGQAVKMFTVTVEDKPSTHVWAIVIVVIVILAILIGGGFLVRKTILQKKSLDNLREHVYPEEGVIQTNNHNDG